MNYRCFLKARNYPNKLKKELKWKPVTTIKDGLFKTIDWYINNLKYFKSISKKDIVKRIGKI